MDNGAKVVILSGGILDRLKVQEKVEEQLTLEGITVYILKTKGTVKLYNELSKSEAVGALIHTTC